MAELEQSLVEIDRAAAPWIVDRALRSFLADSTGNTHRAEFSIDKLRSPIRRRYDRDWSSSVRSSCPRTRA